MADRLAQIRARQHEQEHMLTVLAEAVDDLTAAITGVRRDQRGTTAG